MFILLFYNWSYLFLYSAVLCCVSLLRLSEKMTKIMNNKNKKKMVLQLCFPLDQIVKMNYLGSYMFNVLPSKK